ncbi:PREDICTED: uncharacterized protein LOC104715023 [Camelina sativa]|uniref:Uncharacterized protein LOC104715023 n=1 Tax=Camelina sativa TaxID=90675 RepID=A0ABM0TSW2_CAMSA|nr:PREDICTED: uncharacterized protein LOC104715023 [Camelina sativa]
MHPTISFVPTDEVLVTCYLKPYLKGNKDSTITVPIHLVDIYKSNPENISEEFEKGNDKEWFFISERYKMGKDGKRMNRRDNTQIAINAGDSGSVKGDWLMHGYWLESSVDDINNNERVRGDHVLYKIYLTPQAAKKKKEDADFIELVEAGLDKIDNHIEKS